MLTISANANGTGAALPGLQVHRVPGSLLHRFASSIEVVLDECFRSPGYEHEVFGSLSRSSEPVVWIAMDIEGTVIAFLGGYLIGAGRAAGVLRIPAPHLPTSVAEADAGGAVGVLETICVRPRWQRNGLGVRLIRLAEQDLEDQGAGVAVIPGWKVAARTNIARAAERCGYRHELTVAGLWAAECNAGQYTCCERTSACVCEAAFYVKKLGQ